MNSKSRLLVIDDNTPFREQVCEFLSCCDYDVISASNGMDGVRLAQLESPDVVICDVMMPGLDGFGVLERIRAEASTAALPVIFLTARAQRSDLRQGMDLGADDYLTKPFTMDELLRAVEARLSRRREVAESLSHISAKYLRMAERLNHELRTPLTELVGVSDLFRIVGPGDSDAKVRSRLMGILDCSVNRLRHTVEMLLLYTEMSSRGWRPARATGVNDGASVAEMTIDVIEELRSHHSRWNDLVFTVFADAYSSLEPDHLRLVLRELIDNALKFSAAGQEVAVTVRRHASTVSVRIDDRGRGMSPCQIALIGPFQQFDAAEYAQQGLGLGLYVSRIIAQAYGGNLEILPGAVRGLSVSAVFPVRGD